MARSSMRARSSAESGFTLLEIMIVVSIISILAAMSVPKLLDAQRQAHRSKALAVMKQIYAAQLTYREKNGVYAPNIATLVTANLLTSPFTATNFGLQKIGYYEYYTCIPIPSSGGTLISPQANATLRFRVGAQPEGGSTADRLIRGDQMFMALESGRYYEHKAPSCSLNHMQSTLDSTSDSLFGPSYPEIGSQ